MNSNDYLSSRNLQPKLLVNEQYGVMLPNGATSYDYTLDSNLLRDSGDFISVDFSHYFTSVSSGKTFQVRLLSDALTIDGSSTGSVLTDLKSLGKIRLIKLGDGVHLRHWYRRSTFFTNLVGPSGLSSTFVPESFYDSPFKLRVTVTTNQSNSVMFDWLRIVGFSSHSVP